MALAWGFRGTGLANDCRAQGLNSHGSAKKGARQGQFSGFEGQAPKPVIYPAGILHPHFYRQFMSAAVPHS
jgi:hypothetical protein